jgi:phosphodiesterase/alkaline phosphatase D-like protein
VTAAGTQRISAGSSGCAPATTYHYRLVAPTSGGTAQTSDATFTTPAAAPDVATGIASGVTSASATLAGLVTPNGLPTTYQFWYGPTTSYGSATAPVTAGSGVSAQAVAALLTELRAHTTYHYKLVATNGAGLQIGADGTFTTAAIDQR